MSSKQVWRFDDGVIRSHVVATSKDEAIKIFDRTMGVEYRDDTDSPVEIYAIDDDVLLPISLDGSSDFIDKTAGEWIEHDDSSRFL